MIFPIQEENAKIEKVKKLKKTLAKLVPGRLGLSFVIGKKEVFVGLLIEDAPITVKHKKTKLDTSRSTVRFRPIEE